ncbi:MAG TPA: FHA domain-containing protein [Sandaracinaceae bacterium LLY-WYZ-13_1]|nr:FHA domain-containing protein [Sandaracinaceae bacterium LLY-WYZ-13_1]
MLPLLVRITNTQTGETEHSAFASSPVRIGRNQLNELALNEPFVSQWHAVVRFDEHKVRYVDLGSTNGTMMNGRRLARHMQVEVDPQTDLRIGPIQLAFARAQVTPDMYAAPRTTIFNLNTYSGGGGDHSAVSSATIAFNPNDPATLEQNTMFLQPGQQPGQQAGPGQPQQPGPGAVDMQLLLRITEQTKPYYQQYRQTWTQVLDQLRGQIEQIPGPQREGMILCLCQQFPQLAKEPEFRQLIETLGVDPAAIGDVDAAEWVKRLGGGGELPPGAQINTAVAMERVGAVLESFSQAFVELRKGYEQFGEEMALQLVQERNPLHDAQNSGDVLRYLLDWTTDGGERVRELTRAFADLALHQVALLSGVMEGVRSMLQQISPQELSGQRTHALAKTGGGGLLEKIFNFKKANLWSKFTDRHQRLIEEDRFSREVFGRSFARAYFMVTGGHLQGGDDGSGPDANHPSGPRYGHPHTRPYNQ